jgi:hypothetical protein
MTLTPGEPLPAFVQRQVGGGRLNEVEDLLALEDVVPHRRAAEVDVKVWQKIILKFKKGW